MIYVIDGTAALHEDDHTCGIVAVGKAIGELKSTDQVIEMLE